MAQPQTKLPETDLKPQKGVVVSPPQATVSSALAARMAEHSGAGTSQAQEDNLVPLIYVLQTNSPQVNKRDDRYIDGAEPGDIWLRNASQPVIKGDEGFLFQPCHFSKDVVEWIPRDNGGGFVGRHATMPADAEKESDPKNPNRVKFTSPRGTEYKDTRNHAGYAIDEHGNASPYLIPLTSSGHTVSREWMGLMNRQRVPGTNVKPPSWGVIYRLTTKQRHNKDGDWFVLVAENAGAGGTPLMISTDEEYDRGSALFEAFESGVKQGEAPAEDVEAAAVIDDDKIPF